MPGRDDAITAKDKVIADLSAERVTLYEALTRMQRESNVALECRRAAENDLKATAETIRRQALERRVRELLLVIERQDEALRETRKALKNCEASSASRTNDPCGCGACVNARAVLARYASIAGEGASATERLEAQLAAANERCAELAAALDGYKRRIHLLERHNQHFERCESGWCHPAADTPEADPPAILAAVREEAKREGAVEELKRMEAEKVEECQKWNRVFFWVRLDEIRRRIAALEGKG